MVKKFKQNLPENYSKSTKIAYTACKFTKISRGSMPPDPLNLFLFLNHLQICSAENKMRSKKCGNCGPSSFKISRCATGSDHYSCFYFRNLTYAALFHGDTCLCAQTIKGYRKPLEEKECEIPCSGNINENCGGDAGVEWYRLKPPCLRGKP